MLSPVTIETSGASEAGIQLALPFFEGPLDLLLHLIEREELDITSVALVAVADQYLAILHEQEQINLDALADFIWIGARLLLLKSRALLPRPPAADDDMDEEEDVGEELARRLREYKIFKEAASQLRGIETAGLHAYPRVAPPPELPPPPGLDGVTLERLRALVETALSRKPEVVEPVQIIRPHKVTVRETMALLRDRLAAERRISFREIVDACASRMEIIVAFLAVLELIKSRVLDAVQDDAFADIVLVPAEEPALEAAMSSEFDD
jgi:segregation and condensation protein A